LAVALTTLHAYVCNILKNQEIVQFRSINSANTVFRERVGRYEAGQEVMRTIGFTLEESGRWTLNKSADLARVWLVKTEIVSRLLNAESDIAK
jgi:PUB domain